MVWITSASRPSKCRFTASYHHPPASVFSQPNISFFAFTATPKYKTLEVFGHPGSGEKPKPFHLYTMRQAIDESFILDVLQHYTTYKTYYRLVKSIQDDPQVDKRKASKALARFMSLHPHNIAQKTEVMVEHFRHFTMNKIGGKAKAMVVTSSRLHAVRYKQSFDDYIKQKGYSGIKTLVAFSGKVVDPDATTVEYTEGGMNLGIHDKQISERFGTDEYQVLLVAEKFQKTLIAYKNLYSFLSQVIPFQDSDLEMLYSYGRFLLTKLPKGDRGPIYDFNEDVALKYYRLQRTMNDTAIELEPGKSIPISGPIDVGTGTAHTTPIELSKLIDILNERFGTEFRPGDQLFFDSIREDAVADETLRQAAQANTMENFSYVFRKTLENLFIDRMDQNEEITAKFMNEKDFQEAVSKHLMQQVYSQIRAQDEELEFGKLS